MHYYRYSVNNYHIPYTTIALDPCQNGLYACRKYSSFSTTLGEFLLRNLIYFGCFARRGEYNNKKSILRNKCTWKVGENEPEVHIDPFYMDLNKAL